MIQIKWRKQADQQINNIICNMYGSQQNPESPNRYAFLKQSSVNSHQINSNLGFLNNKMNEIKEADSKLQEGIQDTRNTLIKHLQPEQINHLPVIPRQVGNNKYPNLMVAQTTKNHYDGQRVTFNNFHTPVASQSNSDSKNFLLKKPAANSIPQPKLGHSEPVTSLSFLNLPSQRKEAPIGGNHKDRMISEQNLLIQKREIELRNLQGANFQHKIQCLQCQRYKGIIKNLQDKLKQVNQKAHNDSKQFLFEFKIVSSERDNYKLKLAQFDKDKAQELGNLQKIIDQLRKRESNSANQKPKFKYLNDSTKSQNVTSLKLQVEQLKYKNNHLNKKIKEKSEKITDLQILIEQVKTEGMKNSSISKESQRQDQALAYQRLVNQYQNFKSQKFSEIGEIMKRFELANQRLQQTQIHNQNMFHEINELNDLVQEYRQQNNKLKLLNQKYEIDLQKKEEQTVDLHGVIEQFKEKNMETVSQYNQLVQKCELLEQKTKRLSYLETEVSSQVSGKRSHKQSEQLWEKKEKQLLSKIQHLDHQIELINRQKQAEIEERKVYEIKSKELYEKIRELNQQNYKLRCTIRDQDSQKSEIVYFNKQKIDSLLSPNYSRANSVSSSRVNDKEFLEKDKVVEKVQGEKHALNLEQIKTKVEALMKKVEILGGHLPNQSHLLRQQSNKSKFKINQVQIPSMETPSSRSKTKLHRHSQSNAQIQFTQQNPSNDPNYIAPSASSGQIVKIQNEIYGEWKEWSIEMGKISKQLELIIEQQNHEKNILVDQIQELNLQKARIYASLGSYERQIEKLVEENHKMKMELDDSKMQLSDYKQILKQKQQYDIYLKAENQNNEHRSQQYRKQSQKFQAEYQIAKTKLDVLQISNKQWQAHFVRMEKENLEIMNQNKELREENLSLSKFKIQIEQKITKENQLNFNKIKAQESANLELKKQITELNSKISQDCLSYTQEKQQNQEIIKNLKFENSNLILKINQLENTQKNNGRAIQNLVSQLQNLQSVNERIKEEHKILQKINQEVEFENIEKIKKFEDNIAHLVSNKSKLEQNLITAQNYIEEILKENQYLKAIKSDQIFEEEQKEIEKLNKQLIEQKAIRLKLQKELQTNQKNILSLEKTKSMTVDSLSSVLTKLSQIEGQKDSKMANKLSSSVSPINDLKQKDIVHQIDLKISRLQQKIQSKNLQYEKVEHNLIKAQDHIVQLYSQIENLKNQSEVKLNNQISRLVNQINDSNNAKEEERNMMIRQFNCELKELENLLEQKAQINNQKQIQVQEDSETQLRQNIRNIKNKIKQSKQVDQHIKANLSAAEQKVVALEEQAQRLKQESDSKNYIINTVQELASQLNKQITQQKAKIQTLEKELVENYAKSDISKQENDRIIGSIYTKLLGIDRMAQISNWTIHETAKDIQQIRSNIENKVDELKIRLEEEQIQHKKAYQNLSKAEDHILQLYSDIKKLKVENQLKENQTNQLRLSKELNRKLTQSLEYSEQVNRNLQGELSKVSLQIQELRKLFGEQIKQLKQAKLSWRESQPSYQSSSSFNQLPLNLSDIQKFNNEIIGKNQELINKNQALFEELSQIAIKYNIQKLENKKITQELINTKQRSQEITKQNQILSEINKQLKNQSNQLNKTIIQIENQLKRANEKSQKLEQDILILQQKSILEQNRLLQQITLKEVQLKAKEQQKQKLLQQIKLQAETVHKLEDSQKRKDKIIQSVYQKILGIKQISHQTDEHNNRLINAVSNLDQIIEKKVDQLKLKLEQEKIENLKTYDSLSKAQDHILQLYANIERLKQESELKEIKIKESQQFRSSIIRLDNEEKKNVELLEEVRVLNQEIRNGSLRLEDEEKKNVELLEEVRVLNQEIRNGSLRLEDEEKKNVELLEEVRVLNQEIRNGSLRLEDEEKKNVELLEEVRVLNQEIRNGSLRLEDEEKKNVELLEEVRVLNQEIRNGSLRLEDEEKKNVELLEEVRVLNQEIRNGSLRLEDEEKKNVELLEEVRVLNQEIRNGSLRLEDEEKKNVELLEEVRVLNQEIRNGSLRLEDEEKKNVELLEEVRVLNQEIRNGSLRLEDEEKKNVELLEEVRVLNQEIRNGSLRLEDEEKKNVELLEEVRVLNQEIRNGSLRLEDEEKKNVELLEEVRVLNQEIRNGSLRLEDEEKKNVELLEEVRVLNQEIRNGSLRLEDEEKKNVELLEEVRVLNQEIRNGSLRLEDEEKKNVELLEEVRVLNQEIRNGSLRLEDEEKKNVELLEEVRVLNQEIRNGSLRLEDEEKKNVELLEEVRVLSQEIRSLNINLSVSQKENSSLKLQLFQNKDFSAQTQFEQLHKSRILNSVYYKLQDIINIPQSFVPSNNQPQQNIELLIQQKVEQLILRLKQEQTSHKIVSEQAEIFKQEVQAKQILLRQIDKNKREVARNLESKEKQNTQLKDQVKKLIGEIQKQKSANQSFSIKINGLEQELKASKKETQNNQQAKASQISALKQQIDTHTQQKTILLAQLAKQKQNTKSIQQNLSNLQAQKQRAVSNLVAAQNYIQFLLKQNQDQQAISKLELKSLQEKQSQIGHQTAKFKQTVLQLSNQNNQLSQQVQQVRLENQQLRQIVDSLEKNQVALCQQIGILNQEIDKLMQAIKQSQQKIQKDHKKLEHLTNNEHQLKQQMTQIQILTGQKSQLKQDVARLESFVQQIIQENMKYRQENQALKTLVEDLEDNGDSLKEQLHGVIIQQAKCMKIIQEFDQDQIREQVVEIQEQRVEGGVVLDPHQSISQVLERNSQMIRILTKSLQTQELITKKDKQKYQQAINSLQKDSQTIQDLTSQNEQLQQQLQQLSQSPKQNLVPRTELQTTFNNLVKAQQYIDHLQQQKQKLITQNNLLEQDCQELNSKVDLMDQEIRNFNTRCGMLEDQNRGIVEEYERFKAEFTQTQIRDRTQREILQHQLTDLARNLQQQKAQKLAYQAETKKISTQLNKVSQQNIILKSELEQAIGQKNAAINQIQRQVQNLQQTKSKLETVLSDFSQAYEEESSKLNKKIELLSYQQVQIIENYNRQIEENTRITQAFNQLQARQRNLIENFDTEVQQLRSQLQEQSNQNNLLREEKANLLALLTEVNSKAQQLNKTAQIVDKLTTQNRQQNKIINDLQNLLNQKLIQLEKENQTISHLENYNLDLSSKVDELNSQVLHEKQLNRIFMEESEQIKARLEELYQDRGRQLIERDTLRLQLNQVGDQLAEEIKAKEQQIEVKSTVEKQYEQACQKLRSFEQNLNIIIEENKKQAQELVHYRKREQQEKVNTKAKQLPLEKLNADLSEELRAEKLRSSQKQEEFKAIISEKQKQLQPIIDQVELARRQCDDKQAIVEKLNQDITDLNRKLSEIEEELLNQQRESKTNFQNLSRDNQQILQLLSQKNKQVEQQRKIISNLQSGLADLAAKLEFQTKDKAEILKDTTQMWNDLQAAGQKILYLQSNINRIPETNINQERKAIEKLQEENGYLRQVIIRIEEQTQKDRQNFEKTTQAFSNQKESFLAKEQELQQKLKACENSLAKNQALLSQKGKNTEEILSQKEERIKKLASQLQRANNQLVSTHNQLQLTHTQIESTMGALQKIQTQFQILNESNLERQQKLQKSDELIKNLQTQNQQWKNKLSRAQSHIAYQEQYIDEVSRNQERFIQSQQRCIVLQNRIHELQEHLRELISPEARERVRSTDQDFIKVQEYFLKAIEDQKRSIYQKFISQHPENKEIVKIDNGQLIILGGSQKQIKMQEISDLNQKIVEVSDKKNQISQSLSSLKDNDLKLSVAEKKIKDLQNELSRHQSKKTSLASSLEAIVEKNLKSRQPEIKSKEDLQDEPKKQDKHLKVQQPAVSNQPSPKIQQIEALRETVYSQQERIAILQQQLQNKKIQIEQLLDRKKELSPIKQKIHEASPLDDDQHTKHIQSTKTISELMQNIKELTDQLASEENQHFVQLKNYEQEINNLNRRIQELEEKNQGKKAAVEKLNKQQHVLKQNLSIVEGVRDQLAEENSMLAQQVARYEEIITELQNKQASSPPKSARDRLEVQALHVEIQQLKGKLQIVEQQKAEAIKQLKQKLEKSEEQNTQASEQLNQLLKQKLILQDQLSQQHLQTQRSLQLASATQDKWEQANKEYLLIHEENIKLKENNELLTEKVNKLESISNQLFNKEKEEVKLKEELKKVSDEKQEFEENIHKLQTQKKYLKESYDRLSDSVRMIEEQLNLDSKEEIQIVQKENSQVKSQQKQEPNKQVLKLSDKVQKINEKIKLQTHATNELKIQNIQLISQNQALKTTNNTLIGEVQVLNNNIKDFDGKMKQFQTLTVELEKQLKEVYNRLSQKQKKQAKYQPEKLLKQNQELKDKIKRIEHDHNEATKKMNSEIVQLERKQAGLIEQNLKISQKLHQAQRKLQDNQPDRDVQQEIEKARLSLDEGFKKQKSRRSSIDKQKLTDKDRINMLQRIIYQLEEQVKSFERSVENLTEQLSVYQDKEAEWVESQSQMSEIIDAAAKISTSLQKIKSSQYKQAIPIEQIDTKLPWLANLNRLIRQTSETYQKNQKAKNQEISSLKELKSERSISASERQSGVEKTPSHSSEESAKPQQQKCESNIIEERYEELIKQYVSLENQNKILQKEVDKLEQEVEGYKKKVAELAMNLVESTSANKSELQSLELRKKLQSTEHQLLKIQGEKDVNKLLQNEGDEDEYEPIRLRSRDFQSEESPDLITFLNNCLGRLETIQQNSQRIQRQCEEKNERLQSLIEKVRGEYTPQASVRKSQELVNQFRQLLYSQQQAPKQAESNNQPSLKLPWTYQYEQREEKEEQISPERPKQILQVPNQFGESSQVPQFMNLIGPLNINDRNQLIKQIKQLSDLMNLYHSQYENIKNKYSKNIKKLQSQLNKVKDISSGIVNESGGEMVEGSAVEKLVLKVSDLLERLNIQYTQLLDHEDTEKISDLEIIQEDVHNQDAENKSIGTPKSNRRDRIMFTPKSGYSSKSQKQFAAKYRDIVQGSHIPQDIECNNSECQTNIDAKPFIDYLLDSNQFERAELLELKRKIAAMRSRQDKINFRYLEEKEEELEDLVKFEKQRLPETLKGNMQKIIEILSLNVEENDLKNIVELGLASKLIDKVIEVINIDKTEENQQYEQFFEASKDKQKRKNLIKQANIIRTKYYYQDNQFSVDVLDCLIGFYQETSDSEEFLVIVDKIFETIAEMQKNMEKSIREREKLVESHGEALKKILQKQWEEEGNSANQSPTSKYSEKQYELKPQQSEQSPEKGDQGSK